MYNLIQIQEEIKNLPLRDVMAYANGKNPQVPPYVALGELNRRKQLDETAKASQAQPQPTVKQQVEGSLLQGSQFANNPTTPPQIANPTQAPQMGSPMQAMRGANPAAAPQQVNPTQAANPAMMNARPMARPMASGGLATLPTKMFNQQNFAGGGIVAFAEGDLVEEMTPEQREEIAAATDPNYARKKRQSDAWASIAGSKTPYLAEDFRRDVIDPLKSFFTKPWDKAAEADAQKAAIAKLMKEKNISASEAAALYNTKDIQTADQPVDFPTTPGSVDKKDQPAPNNTTTAQGPTAGAPAASNAPSTRTGLPSVAPARKAISEADIDKEMGIQKMINEKFGIAQDPNAPIRERLAAIEEQRKLDRESVGMRGFINTLGTIGASGATTLGQAMGEGAKAGTKFDQEQMDLRDRQDTAMADKQAAIIREDEARKNNDAKAVRKAIEDQRKADLDWYQATTNRISANRPTSIEEQERLSRENPELFERLYGKKDPMSQYREKAIETYLDPMKNVMIKKEHATLDSYLKSLGLQPLSQTEKAGGTLPKGWTVTENKK
jgi:hypothetical protein